MRYAMIMAGGAGTRLWPISRAGQPKQLVKFIRRPGDAEPVSLLEVAAERMDGLVPTERQYICTGSRYCEQICAGLPGFTPERLLGEPEGRDTLNAVGFAAAVFGKDDPDAVFAVLTADHLISPQARFIHAMETGYEQVERDQTNLVTFGITTTHPETGYGYIEQGTAIDGTDGLAFAVDQFIEKPPLPDATAYHASDRFYWNAGMFIFHARTFMDLLAKFHPATHAGLMRLQDAWGTPDQQRVLEAVYPKLEKTSVDYGIMEPASKDPSVSIVGVKMDVDWLDVGSWPSYGQTLTPDGSGNRVSGCTLAAHDAGGNLVIGDDENHTVALIGCEDLIVVRTQRATLVMPRGRAQDLKTLHAGLPDALK